MNMTTVPEQKYQINFPGMRNLIRDPNLSCQEKVLALNLVMYAGVDGKCFPSQKTLGEDLSFSSRYISTLLAGLRNRGIIMTQRRGYSKSLNYSLTSLLLLELQEEDKNTSSSHIVSTAPLHIGTTVLPKERSKEITVSSDMGTAQQLFQKYSYKGSDISEVNRLTDMVAEFGDLVVTQAINEAHSYTGNNFTAGYLSKKLNDWRIHGVPAAPSSSTRVLFVPCGECEDGHIYYKSYSGEALCRDCDCYLKWKNERR